MSSLVFEYFHDPNVVVDESDYVQYAAPTTYHALVVQLPALSAADLADYSFDDVRDSHTSTDSSLIELPSAARANAALPTTVNPSNVRTYVRLKDAALNSILTHCNGSELQLLLSGPTELTAEQIIAELHFNPALSAYRAPLETWLRAQSRPMLECFLLFVTGLPQLPFTRARISVIRVPPSLSGSQPLPVAHTCFRQLDLPDYGDAGTLDRKLRLAITESDGAFHMA
ncbi:E3 ubiquitin-protein ligase huwe1 [Geranomyces variabilis]|uniref:E3 ubiquitin-protein ligase huwe1 n=1 Tax=Geranomyces variabilis TaxID=109894 RepID=A0AAD5XUN0_9FUNG|nr:E3 ubiquitin-protein ligase huwe1 [Geranomyces variabilis]